MKYLLIIAIYSATTGLSLKTHTHPYSAEECETMAAVLKAESGPVTVVETQCIGFFPE